MALEKVPYMVDGFDVIILITVIVWRDKFATGQVVLAAINTNDFERFSRGAIAVGIGGGSRAVV